MLPGVRNRGKRESKSNNAEKGEETGAETRRRDQSHVGWWPGQWGLIGFPGFPRYEARRSGRMDQPLVI